MKLLNSRGVSLVQTLVAVGILGASSVAVMRLTEIGSQGARVTQQKFEQIEMTNTLRSWISDSQICSRNFGASGTATNFSSLTNDPNTAGETVDSIVDLAGNPRFQTDQMVQGGMLKILSMELRDYTVISTSGTTTMAESTLRVYVERMGKSMGTKEMFSDVTLIIRHDDSNTLLDCSAAATGTSYWLPIASGIHYPNGNVGIGPNDPQVPFHINTNGSPLAFLQSATGTNTVLRMGDGTANLDISTTPQNEFRVGRSDGNGNFLQMSETGQLSLGYGLDGGPGAAGSTLNIRGTGLGNANGAIAILGGSSDPVAMARIAFENYASSWAISARDGYFKVGLSSGGGPNIHMYTDSKIGLFPEANALTSLPANTEPIVMASNVELTGANSILRTLDLGLPNSASARNKIIVRDAGMWFTSSGPEHYLVVGTNSNPEPFGTRVELRPDGRGAFDYVKTNRIEGRATGKVTFARDVEISNNLVVQGTVTANSDRKNKEHIRNLENGLDKINSLRPVEYFWKPELKRNKEKQLGLIAQEVKEVFPELVYELKDGTMTMNYIGLIAPMIDSIQELNERLESQEKVIERLIERVDQLERSSDNNKY